MEKYSEAKWTGDLKGGKGTIKLGSGTYEGSYTFASRFENGKGTNPEELIAAAHAGCYSMALSNELANGGFKPESVETKADVLLEMLESGPTITRIKLTSKAHVPGIEKDKFMELANGAKENCPISKVLAATTIELDITLEN